ncbi:hypothetical protein Fleli_1107 [Bernardetia litoralis DSM 6794]|uniref:Uncharacterized protein n=1 Tax=Bernardetia litoralis (strain ATCC 23117 / DSM 6794 / NBRC 15988 / NCIMB 1366 / Fx l1 / Sio-4) TaxID=880071 RepID=I4AHW0_BERLS|nr:hypothetical protein Fleli_1107 [Bernardetia litoralis DSM 6794]
MKGFFYGNYIIKIILNYKVTEVFFIEKISLEMSIFVFY